MIPFRQTKMAFMEAIIMTEGRGRALLKLSVLWWLALLNNIGMAFLDPVFHHPSLNHVTGVRVTKPVFLVGHSRSGVSRVLHTLQQSSEFVAPSLLDMHFPSLCLHQIALMALQMDLVRFLFMYVLGLSAPDVERLEEEHSALIGLHRWRGSWFVARVLPWCPAMENPVESIAHKASDVRFLNDWYRRLLARTGSRRVVGRVTLGICSLVCRELATMYPEMKLVVFSHAPRDIIPRVLAGYNTQLKRDGYGSMYGRQLFVQRHYERLKGMYAPMEELCRGLTGVPTNKVNIVLAEEVYVQLSVVCGSLGEWLEVENRDTLFAIALSVPLYTPTPLSPNGGLAAYGLPEGIVERDFPKAGRSICMGATHVVQEWRGAHRK